MIRVDTDDECGASVEWELTEEIEVLGENLPCTILSTTSLHIYYIYIYTSIYIYITTNKLHDLSPRANYTNLATAACRRS
jgi:hypothetical protein